MSTSSGWKWWPDKPQGPVDDAYRQVRFTRPYRVGPWRVAAVAALGLVAVLGAAPSLVVLLSSRTVLDLVASFAVLTLVGALPLWLASRVLRSGLWVTDDAVRVSRPLHRDRVEPWSRVVDVRTVAGPVPLLGTPARVTGRGVWLVLEDGTDLPTPVTDRSADLLGRPEAFLMAESAVDRWWSETQRRPR